MPAESCVSSSPGTLKKRARGNVSVSSLIDQLECSVCLETILPPINQCESGHLICTGCRAALPGTPAFAFTVTANVVSHGLELPLLSPLQVLPSVLLSPLLLHDCRAVLPVNHVHCGGTHVHCGDDVIPLPITTVPLYSCLRLPLNLASLSRCLLCQLLADDTVLALSQFLSASPVLLCNQTSLCALPAPGKFPPGVSYPPRKCT